MIRTLFFSPGKPIRKGIPISEFPKLLRDRNGVLWVDFDQVSPEDSLPILQRFGFHELAINDALQQTHSPKVDDWGDYLYIVLNHLDVNGDGKAMWKLDLDELDIFLGKNYLVTHHDLPLPAIEFTWQSCDRDPRILQEGADHLLYKIIDHLVTGYMPTVEKIDEVIDELEDQIFDKPSPRTLEKLFALKRVLLAMRRILLPQREVLNKLARDDYRVIDPKDRIFFRDIYDHLVRLHDLNENLRDLVGGALDTYLSVVNNRMNEIMKTLTTITTLFMPMSFIAAIFGMNYFLPKPEDAVWEWMQRPFFYFVIGLLVIVPIIMYAWMRRRTWI